VPLTPPGHLRGRLAGHRGTADPLHGDALNKAVRDAAQETMAAIFDAAPASEQLQSAGRMQGFGSDGVPAGGSASIGTYGAPIPPVGGLGGGTLAVGGLGGAGGYAPKVETGAYSTGRMQGFGNPTFDHRPQETSKLEKFASSMATGLKEGVSKIQAKIGKLSEDGYASHGGSAAFSGGGFGGGSGTYGGGSCGGSHSGFGAPVGGGFCAPVGGGFCGTGAGGNSGGSFGGFGDGAGFQPPPAALPGATSSPHRAGQPGGGWGAVPSPLPASNPPLPVSTAPPAEAAGEYEARLVDEVTAPGGVRASISREELRKFVTAVKSLDSRAIAALLQARLEGTEWQRRLKALMVIEGLLKEGDDAVLGHFQKNVGCIQAQLGSSQASLKEKARKLLDLLGVEHAPARTSSASTASVPPSAARSAEPQPQLLDLGGDELPSPSLAADNSTLFNGLTVDTAPGSSSAEASLFGGLQLATPAPAPAPLPPDDPSDMFAGLALSAEEGPAEPQPAALAPPPVAVPSAEAATRAAAGASPDGLSELEMMLAQTPSSPAQPARNSPAAASSPGGGKGLAGMKANSPAGQVAPGFATAQQQMAMMQQQMAMMQQQILQQQHMLRMGGGMQPGMGAPRMMAGPRPGMPIGMMPQMGVHAGPACVPPIMGVGGSSKPISLDGADGSNGAFSFVNGSNNDAFDFVGAELSKNKRAL